MKYFPQFYEVISNAGFMASTASLATITLRDRTNGHAASATIDELHLLFERFGLGVAANFAYSAPVG